MENLPNNLLLRPKLKPIIRWLLIGYLQAGRISTNIYCGMDTEELEIELNTHLNTWIKWTELNTIYTKNDCYKYWPDLLYNRDEVLKYLLKLL